MCQRVKETLPDTRIWVWTGYEIDKHFTEFGDTLRKKNFCDIIKSTDVIIDGPFVEALKPGDHAWRGSSNQNIIVLKP